MRKPRWRAVVRANGYRVNSDWQYCSKGKWDGFCYGNNQTGAEIILEMKMSEAPECKWCRSGEINQDGWFYACPDCEGTGVDMTIYKNNRLEVKRCHLQ